MKKKDVMYLLLTLILLILFFWQILSKSDINSQLSKLSIQASQLQKYNNQLSLLSGIGPLKSTHIHADVKIYISGQPIDFSQKKYQLTTSYIHFEDGLGDVVHIHATGMRISHLLKSVGMNFKNNCLVVEGTDYCDEKDKKLKFYVNGKLNTEFENYLIKDLDKMLISYGSENDGEIQKQLSSVTDLAQKYSENKQEME